MWMLFLHHRSVGFFAEQSHYRALLRFRHHKAFAVLLDAWSVPESDWPWLTWPRSAVTGQKNLWILSWSALPLLQLIQRPWWPTLRRIIRNHSVKTDFLRIISLIPIRTVRSAFTPLPIRSMSVITNSIRDTKIIFWPIVSPVFRLLRLPHRRIFQTAPWQNVCLQKRRSVFLCRVAHSSLTKATTSRPFTIWSEMFIMGIVSFRWISEILNPWKSCRPVIRSLKPVLLWTRTVYFRIMDVPVRNTAVRSSVQDPVYAHAVIKTGTTAKRTADARNMWLYLTITVFPLTGNASHSKKSMQCALRLNGTIPALKTPFRNGYGSTAFIQRKIWTVSHTSLCLALQSLQPSQDPSARIAVWSLQNGSPSITTLILCPALGNLCLRSALSYLAILFCR